MLRDSYLKPIKSDFSLNNASVVIATAHTIIPAAYVVIILWSVVTSQTTVGITRSHIPCYRSHLEFCVTLKCVNQQQAIQNFTPLQRSHTFMKKKAKSSKMKVITMVRSKNHYWNKKGSSGQK